MNQRSNKETNIEYTLALVAGFSEAVCILGLFGSFTTFITGTIVLAITDFASNNPNYITKTFILFAFILLQIFWIYFIRRLHLQKRNPATIMLFLESGLMLLFFVSGSYIGKLSSPYAANTFIISFFAIATMSLHSTIFFRVLNKKAPTHFMTGNSTNLFAAAFEMLDNYRVDKSTNAPPYPKASRRAKYYLGVIMGFITGVILGTIGYKIWGFLSLALPVVMTLFTAVSTQRHDPPPATDS
ncbi:YoaK family protein [Microbulbifer sp. SSSA008]|uniref:YoaK family protein n=1 Tax=unclassified Microbulbifer TaxID=2619833 RepID=UPI002B2C8268|nr:YoaK family protein [Microbulbifer sp. MKSA007]